MIIDTHLHLPDNEGALDELIGMVQKLKIDKLIL